MIEVRESKQDNCKYAEYDMEGKHCKLEPLSFCPYRDEKSCPEYKSNVQMIDAEESNEERNAHSGITLDLEKISFDDLCNLRDMVDEELMSRRNEQDRLIEEFRDSLEALINSGAKVYYMRSNDLPVKSFTDFSIYYKN